MDPPGIFEGFPLGRDGFDNQSGKKKGNRQLRISAKIRQFMTKIIPVYPFRSGSVWLNRGRHTTKRRVKYTITPVLITVYGFRQNRHRVPDQPFFCSRTLQGFIWWVLSIHSTYVFEINTDGRCRCKWNPVKLTNLPHRNSCNKRTRTPLKISIRLPNVYVRTCSEVRSLFRGALIIN